MDELKVKQIRLAKQMSRRTVAKAVCVHENTLAKWENEPKKIPIGKAYELCEVLGVDFDRVIFLS